MIILALRKKGLLVALAILALDAIVGPLLIAWEIEHVWPLVKP